MNSLLRALREVCNISSNDREDYFADEMFVSEERKARYKVEKQTNKKHGW